MLSNAQLRKHLPNRFLSKCVYAVHWLRKVKMGKRIVIYLSARLLRFPKNISIGDDAVIKGGVQICACNENAIIEIGERTTIGFYAFIYSSEKIIVGADCMIAPFVYVVDSNHSMTRSSLMNRQPNVTLPVIIEDDVWLGARSIILPGVRIKRGAVVAAGSLVNCDIDEYAIYAGSPAKKIGDRR